MTAWSVTEVPGLRGLTVEWVESNYILFSKRNCLYTSATFGPPFQSLGEIPISTWKKMVTPLRVGQRLLRHFVYNVIRLKDGSHFVTFDKTVGILKDGKFFFLRGLARPCRVLRGAAAVDRCGNVFFGEYLPNQERSPMRVYCYIPGEDHVEVVFEFSAGAVRHVHGIYYDAYDDTLWCATGDVGHEARLLRTRDGFGTVEHIGQGDESWRCVSLLFTTHDIYYATDAEYVQNRIFQIERSTGVRRVIGEIDGPVYYSYKLGEDLFFAVTAELCPSQLESSASIWHFVAGQSLSKIISFEKDILSVHYFMPGTVHFSGGKELSTEFYFHAVGLSGADNRTFCVRREGAHKVHDEFMNESVR